MRLSLRLSLRVRLRVRLRRVHKATFQQIKCVARSLTASPINNSGCI